ncbi:MAG: hypothetical protein HYY06_18025 [Deltaproteobacteria bacterium]|nr:hypothetical protein [Deltaproteobacteria bacterium]
MAIERGFKAVLRYRSDEFLSSGAGKQLLFLFILSMVIVVFHVGLALVLGAVLPDTLVQSHPSLSLEGTGAGFLDKFWFYFTRILDAGTMGGDEGHLLQIVSTTDTILGVIVAGLLISALAGNFQERLDEIKRGGAPVMEHGHFLVLGWSEKIYSVIDQLSEANVEKGKIIVVVMADREKIEMEEKLRDKVVHQDRVKLVVRAGSSVSLNDLAKVSFDHAQAIVVLCDEADVSDPDRADARIIKTLMALYNHPDGKGKVDKIKVTAEVMLAANQEIAEIASDGKAQVTKTNEIISKIILQTSRISGLSIVYDELLRFEGNEIHYAAFPQIVGKRFGDVLLDFSNGNPVGIGKADGSSHMLNPPSDYVIQADEELLILAEDDHIEYRPYQGPLSLQNVRAISDAAASKPVEHLLVLGWNEKIFPIMSEFDDYVGKGSTLTLVNSLPAEQRHKELTEKCGPPKNVEVRHLVGEFTSRALMERLQPQNYPTVMVLGDATRDASAEDADTRAIIALLLLRDFRRRAGVARQEVCSEILNPKNRELAATTQIHDIVISNEMVSMFLAQITHEPRVRAVLEDLFRSEGSEIYLKDITHYAHVGQPITFEHLVLAAKSRGEVAMGVQAFVDDPEKRYGLVLNPKDRSTPFIPKSGDRLVVMAEDDG